MKIAIFISGMVFKMETTSVGMFNQIVAQYQTSIAHIKILSLLFAKETFNYLALIAFAAGLINYLLKKNVDMVEANLDSIKTLLMLYFFFGLIKYYDSWLPVLFQTFKGAGKTMAGPNFIDNPGAIINTGLQLGTNMIVFAHNTAGWNLPLYFAVSFISVICAGMVIFCFGRIAVELVLIDIGGRIILAGGIFMLGFAGSPWTKQYAERYITTTFNLGIKMMFLYVVVSIGNNLTDGWLILLSQVKPETMIETYLSITMATFIFYMLSLRLPDMASGFFTAQSSFGFSSNDATVRSVIQGGAVVAATMASFGQGMGGSVATAIGMKKAVDAAQESTGKSGLGETLNTLTKAAKSRIFEKIDAAALKTSPGRLSMKIKSEKDQERRNG